jgi:DNA-binding response OmpR family regulator
MARILVIDDDEQIRTTLRRVLELEGHEVLVAADGKEGVKLFREQGADLIITDIVMPDKEGLETIMELRRDFRDAKIVAISGGGHIDGECYLMMAEQLGAGHTLTKPFEREQLLAAVGEALA